MRPTGHQAFGGHAACSYGVRQCLVVLGALALCPIAAALIGDDPAGAVARTRALMSAEGAIGVDVESAAHAWALDHPGLMAAACVFYLAAHVAVTGWALIWTWAIRRDRFALVRDTFIGTQILLVAVQVLLPTAPPRLVPGAGYTDTLTSLWGQRSADAAHVLQSPFAAMPSGHVAFALLAGGVFAVLGDMRWLRAFGWIYPPVVAGVTVITANHLLVDSVAAAVLIGCSHRLAYLRRRRAEGFERLQRRHLASRERWV